MEFCPNFRPCSLDFSMDSCERPPIATNPCRNWQNIQILKLFFGPCGKSKLIYMVGRLVVIVCSDTIETYHVCPDKNHHQKFQWKQIQLEACLFSNMWTRQSVNKTVNDSRISCRCHLSYLQQSDSPNRFPKGVDLKTLMGCTSSMVRHTWRVFSMPLHHSAISTRKRRWWKKTQKHVLGFLGLIRCHASWPHLKNICAESN